MTTAAGTAHADGSDAKDFIGDWLARVARTQAAQPHWVTPLVTVTPRLEQEWRSDVVSQSQPHGVSTLNYGNGKGLELIPTEHIEVIVGVPAYVEHENSKLHDGFGDVNFLIKYRLLSANEEQGNYILTAFFGASAPTGNHDNGARQATFTPTLAFGKGWGAFDVQGTVAGRIPDGDISRLGTPFLSNTAFQYLVAERVWPEFEVNLTHWPNGDNAGNTEVFLTPGIVVGRLPIWERLGLTLGAGVQIAATHFHTSNHNLIVSLRLPF
ncbi:MAG TPA: hypothetical protein VL403_13690 [Candidatus Kryptonia bacterium]|nr:hypothetical protein [Candidatus Kryptonia bacterium]